MASVNEKKIKQGEVSQREKLKSYTGQSMKGSLKIEKCAQNSCLVLVTLWEKEEEDLCRVWKEAMQKTALGKGDQEFGAGKNLE